MPAMIGTATRRSGAALAAVAVFLLGACGADESMPGTTSPSADGTAIAISGLAFKPDSLEVPAGAEVSWTNEESVRHTVTAGTPAMPEAAFDEVLDAEGSELRFTFEEAGTYPFFCRNHPNGMRGEIRVT
jgi:plastocyanin